MYSLRLINATGHCRLIWFRIIAMQRPFDDEEQDEEEIEFSYVSKAEEIEEDLPSQYEDMEDELLDLGF